MQGYKATIQSQAMGTWDIQETTNGARQRRVFSDYGEISGIYICLDNSLATAVCLTSLGLGSLISWPPRKWEEGSVTSRWCWNNCPIISKRDHRALSSPDKKTNLDYGVKCFSKKCVGRGTLEQSCSVHNKDKKMKKKTLNSLNIHFPNKT